MSECGTNQSTLPQHPGSLCQILLPSPPGNIPNLEASLYSASLNFYNWHEICCWMTEVERPIEVLSGLALEDIFCIMVFFCSASLQSYTCVTPSRFMEWFETRRYIVLSDHWLVYWSNRGLVSLTSLCGICGGWGVCYCKTAVVQLFVVCVCFGGCSAAAPQSSAVRVKAHANLGIIRAL